MGRGLPVPPAVDQLHIRVPRPDPVPGQQLPRVERDFSWPRGSYSEASSETDFGGEEPTDFSRLELESAYNAHALHNMEAELELTRQALECAIFESERRERTIKDLLEVRPPRPVVECPICFEIYGTQGEKVPRVQKCGHIACELCIVGMLEEAGGPRIFCPLCREACMVLDARDLPINWTL